MSQLRRQNAMLYIPGGSPSPSASPEPPSHEPHSHEPPSHGPPSPEPPAPRAATPTPTPSPPAPPPEVPEAHSPQDMPPSQSRSQSVASSAPRADSLPPFKLKRQHHVRLGVYPVEPFPSFGQDALGGDPRFAYEERESPPMYVTDFNPPCYPPQPPLTTDDPTWLNKQLDYLERRRELLLDELEAAEREVKDALAEVTMAQIELEGEVGEDGLRALANQSDEDWARMFDELKDDIKGMNDLLVYLSKMLGPATVRGLIEQGIATATRRGEEVDGLADGCDDGSGDKPDDDGGADHPGPSQEFQDRDAQNHPAPPEEVRDRDEKNEPGPHNGASGQSESGETQDGTSNDKPYDSVDNAAATTPSSSTSRKRKRSPSLPLDEDDGNVADAEDGPSTPKRSRKRARHDGAWRVARRKRLSEARAARSPSPPREMSLPPITTLPSNAPPALSSDSGSSPETDREFWPTPIPGPMAPPPRLQFSPSPEPSETHDLLAPVQQSRVMSPSPVPPRPQSIFFTMASLSRKRGRDDDESVTSEDNGVRSNASAATSLAHAGSVRAPHPQLPSASESADVQTTSFTELPLARPIPKRAKVSHVGILTSRSLRSAEGPDASFSKGDALHRSPPIERPRAPSPKAQVLPMHAFKGFGPSPRDSHDRSSLLALASTIRTMPEGLTAPTEDVPDPDFSRAKFLAEAREHWQKGYNKGMGRVGKDILEISQLVPPGRRQPPPTFQLCPPPAYSPPSTGVDTPEYPEILYADDDIDVDKLLLDAISLPPDNDAPEPVFVGE